jgi:hypothetical protein
MNSDSHRCATCQPQGIGDGVGEDILYLIPCSQTIELTIRIVIKFAIEYIISCTSAAYYMMWVNKAQLQSKSMIFVHCASRDLGLP